jgi:tetratricopeptide (TPR) repeat protein
MRISDQRRPPLPARLTVAERDFYLELRRVVKAAGVSCRALEEWTASPRSGAAEPAFFSKSQWGRWLNGKAPPPRKAVRKLAGRLTEEDIECTRLVDLWDGAFASATPADGVAAEAGPGYLRPRQLPISAPQFVGRAVPLEMLAGWADQVGARNGPVVIVIEGTAGVGKTTLAIHFAHAVSGRFPDGQLYVNMRGFDHAVEPMSGAEALPGLLDALGVAPTSCGVSVDQAALYRSVLAGKRVLIVIDNANDAEQVRHLLPGTRGCLVLVTSRNRLSGLAVEGAHVLRLDPFTAEEAHELLRRRLGSGRVDGEPDAARELAGLCARLPLALGVAAAHAALNQDFPLAVLTQEFQSRGLDLLDTGDPATTTRTVIARSYRYLSGQAALMFRLFGLHPGPDISLAAAASLSALPANQVRRALDELARAHLVEEHLPDRFTFHALLRAYAAEQAHSSDSEDERRAALRRLLDHELHTAMAASARFSPYRQSLPLDPPGAGVTVTGILDRQQAIAWFKSETPALLALTRLAYAEGFDTHAWLIPWTLALYLHRRGRWREFLTTQQVAVAAATRLGEEPALAHSHYHLAHAQAMLLDYQASELNVRQSLAEFRELDDRGQEAIVLNGLADLLQKRGRYTEALEMLLDGLRMIKAAGHWQAQAMLEKSAGQLYAMTGEYGQALAHCQRALALYRESDNPSGTAETLASIGFIYRKGGDLVQARSFYEWAIAAFRELGELFDEAQSLDGLGDTLLATGDADAARAAWIAAKKIVDEMSHPLAGQVRAKLAALTRSARESA